ncbi:MAG: hypothetical protein JSS51_09790 [Planctomycetes bacterium]|nr:hypothetical protein [Planctomycetota bacterium]
MSSVRIWGVVASLLAAMSAARAGCATWLPGAGVAGVNGLINAMTLWDPDGDGPEPTLLVVAGTFTAAGDIAANNIAAWDGQSWRALGGGITSTSSPTSILALAVYQGQLFAGGSFVASTSVANLLRWDGAAWVSAGGYFGGSVNSLCVFGGELIAGGAFVKNNSIDAQYLAAFDGTAWRQYAGGTNKQVLALASDGQQLFVGGTFTLAGTTPVGYVASWDGAAWSDMNFGVLANTVSQTTVSGLLVVGSDLIVCGRFDLAGGSPALNVATWNGVYWEPMSTGLAVRPASIFRHRGVTLAGSGTQLFEWNGWVWTPAAWQADAAPSCFIEYGDKLIAGGGFGVNTPDGFRGIARLDASGWRGISPGFTRTPGVVFTFNGVVYAGFSNPTGGIALLAWNGGDWFDPYSTGPLYWRSVTAIGEHQGELVVAGVLADRNDPAPRSETTVARWHSGTWERIGKNTRTVNGAVVAFATFEGNLIIGGDFSTVDSVGASSVARWNGTAWQAMGGTNGTVHGLAVHAGKVIVAGSFTAAGPTSARSVAAWTSSGFQTLGAGLDGTVRSVIVHQGALYAGGGFTRSGAAIVRGVARWDGAAWVQVPSAQTEVYSMLSEPLGLTVVGSFGGIPPNATASSRIARWTGSTWTGFTTGLSATVVGVTRWNDEVIAVGSFILAGGKSSYGFARWSNTGLAEFTSSPRNTDAVCGGRAEFSVEIASGLSGVSFVWRRNGNAIGSNASASTRTLVIDPVSHVDDGVYDCLVTSSCGSVTSSGAALVSTCCPADLNFDSVVDDDDFQMFSIAYNRLACDGAVPGCPADQNRDGVVDDADFPLFLASYNRLECP